MGGLFDTGKGIATLDAKQVEKGLAGSTVGTIDLSLGASMEGAGSAAGGGLGKSVSDLTGRSRRTRPGTKAFRTRYETAMQRGRKGLAKMPYPPVTQ
jgi:hypothetical protein